MTVVTITLKAFIALPAMIAIATIFTMTLYTTNDHSNNTTQRRDYEAELRVCQQMLEMERQREERKKREEERRRQAFSELLNSSGIRYNTRTQNNEDVDPCAFLCAMIMLIIFIPLICN